MANIDIIPLFATPIGILQVQEIEGTVKEHLFNTSFNRMINGWMSDNYYILEDDICLDLKNEIIKNINLYVRDVLKINPEIEFYITNSWVVKHEPNDWSQSHSHKNSILSGVLYLQTTEDTGNLVLEKEDNFVNLFPLAINPTFTEWNIFNTEEWSIQPKNNMLVLFPSHVKHYVTPNTTNNIRYSLAFNVFLRGNLGDTISQLVLK